METIKTDILVIGSGIAGLWYAYKIADFGNVLLITKKESSESNTNYAQGGIAAAVGEDDSPIIHYEDTLRAGEGLAKENIVKIVCEEGPRLVYELYNLGVEFLTYYNSAGNLRFELGKEGGHSRRRIVHAKDYTGYAIEKALIKKVKEKNVKIIENCFLVDLLVTEDTCFGAYTFSQQDGKFIKILSYLTLLATGGLGQVYLHTTNPPIATGDGIALAFERGAKVANMEFIQFHPTSLYGRKINGRSFLISEAVRGEGGILKTLDGKTFMEKYHPLACLAPRDVVARAIDNELKKRKEDYVLLDLTHLNPEKIKSRFPNIYETCLKFGIDITREPIPVVPAAHYICGGILINEYGETTIRNLLSAGEAACSGMHGANRLASNSLLESLVFAERAYLKSKELLKEKKELKDFSIKIDKIYEDKKTNELISKLKKLMWDKVGIVRNDKDLSSAVTELYQLKEEIDKILEKGISVSSLEAKNMIICGLLIAYSASLRKESRGLHYNIDHPEKDDRYFKRDTILTKDDIFK
ncbi:MAG: L-aspartate oxidase [candidate division WOR-3 bacterium]|uniref:L-aspartate oxidase n=1 Tax=candidate division WOR-3 bacterium TaxID=2052148 RepID=A0A7C4S2H6_UNCW3